MICLYQSIKSWLLFNLPTLIESRICLFRIKFNNSTNQSQVRREQGFLPHDLRWTIAITQNTSGGSFLLDLESKHLMHDCLNKVIMLALIIFKMNLSDK